MTRPFPTVTHTITRAHVDAYAELSGDRNPLHMDSEFARAAGFADVIAHGPIAVQTVFAAVAEWLGGDIPPGVRVDVLYRAPVGLGDAITCAADTIREHAGERIVTARCRDQTGREVLQALIVAPR